MFSDKTSDERMNILRMIEEHRITADQGALLLADVRSAAARPEPVPVQPALVPAPAPAYVAEPQPAAGGSVKGKMRFFKVRVTDMRSGRSKVSVTLPLSLVKWGLKFSQSHVPEINNIPIEGLDELIDAGMEGKLVDVEDEEDGEHVEVFIE